MRKISFILMASLWVSLIGIQPQWNFQVLTFGLALSLATMVFTMTFRLRDLTTICAGLFVVGNLIKYSIDCVLVPLEASKGTSWRETLNVVLLWGNLFMPMYVFWKSTNWPNAMIRQSHWIHAVLLSGVMLLMLGFEPTLSSRVFAGMSRLGFLGVSICLFGAYKLTQLECQLRNFFMIFFSVKWGEIILTYLTETLMLFKEYVHMSANVIGVCSLIGLGVMVKIYWKLILDVENSEFLDAYRKLSRSDFF